MNKGAYMDYYLIRKKFCELSGRYDLIDSDLNDNGADFFLNAGQRYLDRLTDVSKTLAKYVQKVSAGTFKVYCEGLRSVRSVWAGASSTGLVQLEKCSIEDLRNYYGKPLSEVDRGTPTYFSSFSFRPHPDSSTSTSYSGYYDVDDVILSSAPSHFTYSGVLIAPPPDIEMYISVIGLFYSQSLSAVNSNGTWTQTKSYWSEVHPDLLLLAALHKLEVFYRNTEGAKDWNNELMLELANLDKDEVDQAVYDINQMEG